MIRVSVIVPVYNAERYLERCVDSIFAQSFTDYELILVDDGSTDGSGKMCDDYARSNPQVRVFHQANQGVSAARQKGLDAASGEYVIFADPDDWVEPTMLEELILKAENDNADVVICDFMVNNELEEHYQIQSPRYLEAQSILRQLLLGELHGSTCNKLYRLKTLKGRNIHFPKNVDYCEDLWFNCEIMVNCKPRVAYMKNAFYHYDTFTNGNSLSRKVKRKTLEDYKSFVSYAINFLDEERDADIVYHLKYNFKRHAFRSDCRPKEYAAIYPELQSRFINTLKSSNHPIIYKSTELLALCGCVNLGRLSIGFYERVIIPVLVSINRIKMRLLSR